MLVSFKSLSELIVLTLYSKSKKAEHTHKHTRHGMYTFLEPFSSAKINQKSHDVFPWEVVKRGSECETARGSTTNKGHVW